MIPGDPRRKGEYLEDPALEHGMADRIPLEESEREHADAACAKQDDEPAMPD